MILAVWTWAWPWWGVIVGINVLNFTIGLYLFIRLKQNKSVRLKNLSSKHGYCGYYFF